MRKITSLLMLLCMFVGTMWADETRIAGLTAIPETAITPENITTGYYLLKEVNPGAGGKPGGFLKAASEAVDAVVTPQGKNPLEANSVDATYIWYIEKGASTYTIASANKRAAWQSPTTGQKNIVAYGSKAELIFTTESVTLGGHTATPIAGSFIAMDKNNTACFHYTNSDLGSWTDANPASVMMFEAYKLDETNLKKENWYTVSYNYKVSGVLKRTIEVDQVDGSDMVSPIKNAFVTFEAPTGNVSASNKSVDIECELLDLPFTLTTNENDPNWQIVEMHRYDGARFWQYNSANQKIDVVYYIDNQHLLAANENLWCFVGDHFGVKIYNKAAGMSKCVNATSGNPAIGDSNDEINLWVPVTSSATQDPAACFTQDFAKIMNRTSGGSVGYYDLRDNGSTCYFFNPMTHVKKQAKTKIMEVYSNIDYTAVPVDAIGVISTETVEELVNLYDQTDDIDDLVALSSALSSVEKSINFIAPGYYFIRNAGTGDKNNPNWYATYGSNGTDFMAIEEDMSAKHVWSFEAYEDGFKLKSCNLDKYASLIDAGATSQITSDYNNGTKFTFISDGSGKFTIRDASGNRMRTENTGAINRWGKDNEPNETWYLIPASQLKITIGDAGWGTTYLPFDVVVPNTVEAYAVTETSKDYATLTKMEDIPARQGAILKGEGTHTLTIANATSDWTANKLEGTFVNTYVGKGAYVLAKPTIDEVAQPVGFYKATLNKNENGGNGETHFLNSANKAYLPASAVPSAARFLSFDFGNETAIDELKGENGNVKTVIYDLAGRRVQKTQKGLYIVNGAIVIK